MSFSQSPNKLILKTIGICISNIERVLSILFRSLAKLILGLLFRQRVIIGVGDCAIDF